MPLSSVRIERIPAKDKAGGSIPLEAIKEFNKLLFATPWYERKSLINSFREIYKF